MVSSFSCTLFNSEEDVRPMTRMNSTGPSVSAAQYCVTRANQFRPRDSTQMSLNVSSMRASIMMAMNTNISPALADTALVC
jgi:hypothetical protein